MVFSVYSKQWQTVSSFKLRFAKVICLFPNSLTHSSRRCKIYKCTSTLIGVLLLSILLYILESSLLEHIEEVGYCLKDASNRPFYF
ncbi:unnamed protein product [Cuscuta campestris]|uniref:Uncharacterized protein n=1 Tax=Cuscuta campestris TaxID=132261 RepID=A0A484KMF1_9ASTE|nr:unnamed protein product [Cuscuta campestris]